MADCKTCKELRAEEQKKLEGQKDVSYVVYETAMARNERTVKRLIIALIVSVVMIVVSNAAWLWYNSMFNTMEYTQDGEGVNIIGSTNEVQQYEPKIENTEGQEPETSEGR